MSNFPPNSISSDGTHVWVTSYNYIGGGITELDASTGAGIWGTYVSNAPDAISSDGAHAWVTDGGDSTVTEIDEQ